MIRDGQSEPLWHLMGVLFKAHPWHGVPIGAQAPATVTCYIEIVASDTVKYELDKLTGHLKLDRPQRYSNACPSLYGFVPQTLCGPRVAAFSSQQSGRAPVVGDGDPLDICVLTEKPITHGDILVRAIPIGGFRMLDGNQADDKIIAVMRDDATFGNFTDINHCPPAVIERLRHYFLTYKELPGAAMPVCEITHTFGRAEAHEVIARSRADYQEQFGDVEALLAEALRSFVSPG
jgi:inorganic pyrophosphatase